MRRGVDALCARAPCTLSSGGGGGERRALDLGFRLSVKIKGAINLPTRACICIVECEILHELAGAICVCMQFVRRKALLKGIF